ncbi:SDR family NAD(P)-dependent oxidoreductase [Sporichthya brevicatena]|uniref:SDR family NAD(P)-dependent oxidoreductase n=1 Tax=Sporichthya brevicatena TaxID=171442 RepID=A0ABN1GQB5_9ACTN
MSLTVAGRSAPRILVVGASQGMGRAAALRLASGGARVALVARTSADLDVVAKDVSAAGAADVLTVAADVTDPAAVAAAVDAPAARWGGLDGLVNAVGLCEPVSGGFLETDDGHWQRAFDAVLLYAVRTCRAALPHLLDGGGAIVNVSAMSSRHYLPMMPHYSSQKLALAHLTKNLAKEFGARGIRTNAVMPGMVESDAVAKRKAAAMAEHGWDDEQFFEYVNTKYSQCTYGGRLGQPDEVGAAIAWLLSDDASYVNGAWLPVDGGSAF